MQVAQEEWSKTDIKTLVGYMQKDNTFVDIDGEIFDAMSYGIINKKINPDQLVCVNMRWSENLKEWIIFQVVEFFESVG